MWWWGYDVMIGVAMQQSHVDEEGWRDGVEGWCVEGRCVEGWCGGKVWREGE